MSINLTKCLVLRIGTSHKCLIHFGEKIEENIRDVYYFGCPKTMPVPTEISRYHWSKGDFREILSGINLALTSSQLVDFLNNDLTQPEIDALSMQLCPELPHEAEARLEREAEVERITRIVSEQMRRQEQALLVEERMRAEERIRQEQEQNFLDSILDFPGMVHNEGAFEGTFEGVFNATTPTEEYSFDAMLSFDAIPKVIEISKECCVCMCEENRLLLGCQHVVCFECFPKISESCPLCRVRIEKRLVKRL